MKRTLMLVVFILLVTLQGAAGANRAGVNFLSSAETRDPEVVVAQFLDPGATGLGKALSYVIWRELLTVLDEPTGSTILLLQEPKAEALIDRLKKGRHQAALEIAQTYEASMILWGEVQMRGRGNRPQVLVRTFVTLNPTVRNGALALQLAVEQEGLKRSFQVELPRIRFNFTRVRMSRADLLARRLITHTAATLHAEPSHTAPVVARVPTGTALEATDMQGTWFTVQRSNGAIAYIDGSEVQVLPRRVEMAQRHIDRQKGSGTKHESTKRANVQETFEVRDMRYRFGQGLWYRLSGEGMQGWVTGSMVRPHFTLPVEHFVACLLHYRSRRFEDAYWACSQFIQTPGVKETNVNLAAAYQVQGASSLIFKDPFSFDATTDLAAFSKAVDLIPYDPAAYNLRALARFGVTRRLDGVFSDLKRALDLAPENPGVRAFVRTLVEVTDAGAFDLPNLDWIGPFLSVERIRQAPHLSLPKQTLELGPNEKGDVILTLKNHTNASLLLYLIGSVTRGIEMRAGQSEDIALAAGTYAIAAEFPSASKDHKPPQARPIYGIQTYDPKTHYALPFYVQWRSDN